MNHSGSGVRGGGGKELEASLPYCRLNQATGRRQPGAAGHPAADSYDSSRWKAALLSSFCQEGKASTQFRQRNPLSSQSHRNAEGARGAGPQPLCGLRERVAAARRDGPAGASSASTSWATPERLRGAGARKTTTTFLLTSTRKPTSFGTHLIPLSSQQNIL